MKIQALPSKETLTHFNVQYYHNNAGQGSANHVVMVKYSTHPDPTQARMPHAQRVVMFNLKVENKAINRLVKDHLGEAEKDKVKSYIKDLKKQVGVDAYFGFRRVQYKLKHKFTKGAWFHKNTIDTATHVYWLKFPDGNSMFRIMWAGNYIEVPMTPQKNPVPGQSLMYGYWTKSVSKEEVGQRINELKDGKAEHEHAEVAVVNDGAAASTNEAELDEQDYDVCIVDEVAGVEGIAEASSVGNDNPAQPVKRKSKRAGKPVQHPGDFSDYGNFGFENGFGILDKASESPFFDKYVERDTNLGTSIRL